MLRELRNQTAIFLSNELRKLLPSEISDNDVVSVENLIQVLEQPKNLDHGHLAFPVFSLAKILRLAPPVIAKKLADQIQAAVDGCQSSDEKNQKYLGLEKATAVGGYVNLTFSGHSLQSRLFAAIREGRGRLGYSEIGKGKKIVIDYSSPNVAKPMHVGTLRATVIGQAIRNVAETQGYEVIGLNHLGDWGVQFGKLAWAYQKWGDQYDFKNAPFQSLFDLYVKFHDEAAKNPELDAQGSLVFKRLEQGDQEIEKIWKMFVEITLIEDQKLWDLLGVKHDLVRGESFYNDRLKPVEDLLEQKGLLQESEGALVVPMGDDMPPCLIRKSDGASLYATRDIASAIYRKEELGADLCLYVVGVDQTLHFKQVFKVLELAGYDWAKDCHHISFGLYRFKDGVKMSTRKGNVIFLEDILRQAIERTSEIIAKKNPHLTESEREQIATDVGVGAVIFGDLVFDRVKNVEFDWDRILSFEGDSGPYVQYMHVRCQSLLRKYGKAPKLDPGRLMNEKDERELIRLLFSYDEILESTFRSFRPNILAQYLLEVCGVFSRFYHNNRILGEAAEVEESRMALVAATQAVLNEGLAKLSIRAPDVM